MKYNNALYPDKINDLIGNDGDFTELGKQLVQAAAGGGPSPSGGSKILYYDWDEMLPWGDESNPCKDISEAEFNIEIIASGLSQVYKLYSTPVIKFKILSMEELLNFFDVNVEHPEETKTADVRISLKVDRIDPNALTNNNIVLNKFSDAERSIIFFYHGDFAAVVLPTETNDFMLAVLNYFSLADESPYDHVISTKDLIYDPKDPTWLNDNVVNLRVMYQKQNLDYTGNYWHQEYTADSTMGRYLASVYLTQSPLYITGKNLPITKVTCQGMLLIIPYWRGEDYLVVIGWSNNPEVYSIHVYELTNLVTYPDIPTEEGDYHLKVSVDSEGAKTFTWIKDE